MKCIHATPAESAALAAVEGIAEGPTGIRARLIRRAQRLRAKTGQRQVTVYDGLTRVVTVSATGQC